MGPTITATEGPDEGAPAPLERGASFGRYIVLGRLGGGGMGVVYSAYDPELDRKLAVKILRPEAARDQARLRREAQAMARLQHPNVISVFDVGEVDGRGFVAMELIDGTTLSQWLDEGARSWREVVNAFLQAGRGLAAAHGAGLIHRDFKPSNVLVGRDGRLRVGDFGLARSVHAGADAGDGARDEHAPPSSPLHHTITRAGSLLGTPTYMAPEQFLGLPAGAPSDQFSFCVALYRALYGQKPFAGDDVDTLSAEVVAGRLRPPPKDSRVPGWVRDVVLRGLATESTERWPSMDALLAALASDPERVRRRWMVGGGALLAIGLAALGARGLERRNSLVCRGAERKLAGVWDDARKAAVHASFAATHAATAEAAFAEIAKSLDAYASQWAAAHTEACEATRIRREQSEELLDLRMECLGGRLQEAAAQIDLFSNADTQIVERATQMTSSLKPVAGCSDVAALRAPVRPPADAAARAQVEALRKQLAKVKALDAAGKYREAQAAAEPLAVAARALAYRPLESEVLFWLGTMQREAGSVAVSARTLEDAAVAGRAGHDTLAEVDAYAGLVWVADRQGDYDKARAWGRHGFAALEALGTDNPRAVAFLSFALGSVAADEGKLAEALRYGERALALRKELYGAESVKTAYTEELVGRVLASLHRDREAEEHLRHGMAIMETQLGPEHIGVAGFAVNLAWLMYMEGKYEEAVRGYQRAAAITEKALGPEHPDLAWDYNNIGQTLVEMGKAAEGRKWLERALAIAEKKMGPRHPLVVTVLTNLGQACFARGALDEALAYCNRAVAASPGVGGAELAGALTCVGRLELERHRADRGLPLLERAQAMRKPDAEPDADAFATRFALARALWEVGRDRDRARALATGARAGYAGLGARNKTELAQVDAWLAAHR